MKTSFAAPSQWWTVARILVIVSAVLASLATVGLLVGGILLIAVVHGTGGVVGGGVVLFFAVLLAIVSALYWWAVKALHRGSNTARWILGLLAVFGVLSGLLSVLHTGGISAIGMLYNGLIAYGLLLDPQVREAFGNGSVKSMVKNVWD